MKMLKADTRQTTCHQTSATKPRLLPGVGGGWLLVSRSLHFPQVDKAKGEARGKSPLNSMAAGPCVSCFLVPCSDTVVFSFSHSLRHPDQ